METGEQQDNGRKVEVQADIFLETLAMDVNSGAKGQAKGIKSRN